MAEKLRDNHAKLKKSRDGEYYYQWESDEYEKQYQKLMRERNNADVAGNNFMIFGYVCLGLSGLLLIFFIVFFLLYLSGRVQKVTVTDKRVYGVASHKSRVDLPLDSISAIATSAFKGLAVASSSGRINFFGIKNRDEIHGVISDLLIERQSKPRQTVSPKSEPEPKPEPKKNVVEEMKQYKELLDMGILTQEEFDAKKKQLLGL